MVPRSKPFADDEDRVLLDRKKRGESWSKIGKSLGRAAGPCEYRYWSLIDPYRKIEEPKTRLCLRCREDFLSDFAGNRLCLKCKKANQGVNQVLEGRTF